MRIHHVSYALSKKKRGVESRRLTERAVPTAVVRDAPVQQ
jgi:hypothetical protein